MPDGNKTRGARIFWYTAVAVIIIIGMHLAAPVLTPILFAFLLAMVTYPFMKWLERRSIPRHIAALVTLAVIILLALLLVILLSTSLSRLLEAAPLYLDLLQDQLPVMQAWLEDQGIDIASLGMNGAPSPASLLPQIATFLGGVISLIFNVLLIFVIIGFLLLEIPDAGEALVRGFGVDDEIPGKIERFSVDMMDYIVVRIKTNLITGIGVALFLFILGIDFALFWGLLAFILSFIPYIGLLLASIGPITLGLTEYGLPGAAVILVGIPAIDFIVENVLFPSLAGRELNLSPGTVLIAVFFWAWVLGIAGVFLAVPLTVFVKMILELSEETRWLAIMMEKKGGTAISSPEEVKKSL